MTFPKSFEKLGLIPRSIYRTTIRFCQQLFNSSTFLVLEEFRFSRYQTIASCKCLINLIFLPFIMYLILFYLISFILTPIFEYKMNQINLYTLNQKQRHYILIQNKQDQVFFDYLITKTATSEINSSFFKTIIQTETTTQKTEFYKTLTNWCLFFICWYLLRKSVPQLIILKSFLLEVFSNLSDPKKAFLLILSTDLLVGFHSSQIWKLSLEILLTYLNLQFSQNFILVIISIFPVFLDTIFKYWIFRFLNKISPSTVAIYHNMIE
uniref:Envelope membrane protein n=1 Tax=Codium arabicum TaxID=221038 RepID=A0A386B0N0_CODAR|nr:Envelope membrane protein [Codium arabicum]AYC65213.1 Envelope membrane protein [Codium arabicum]